MGHVSGSVTRTRGHKPTIANPKQDEPKEIQAKTYDNQPSEKSKTKTRRESSRRKRDLIREKLLERERVCPWKPRRVEGHTFLTSSVQRPVSAEPHNQETARWG